MRGKFLFIRPTLIRRHVNRQGRRVSRAYLYHLDMIVHQEITRDLNALRGCKTLNAEDAIARRAGGQLGRRR